jgi:poly(A) polymerase
MISKIINRLMGKSSPKPTPKFGQRRVISEQVHGIDHTLVDERAMNVVRTLQERGFEAYIV